MWSIDPDPAREPVAPGPAPRSLTPTLDRLDRLIDDTLSGVVVPHDVREHARGRALELAATASDAPRAEPVLALAYASELVQAIAVDLAAPAR